MGLAQYGMNGIGNVQLGIERRNNYGNEWPIQMAPIASSVLIDFEHKFQ